jgi:hypothetical protein
LLGYLSISGWRLYGAAAVGEAMTKVMAAFWQGRCHSLVVRKVTSRRGDDSDDKGHGCLLGQGLWPFSGSAKGYQGCRHTTKSNEAKRQETEPYTFKSCWNSGISNLACYANTGPLNASIWHNLSPKLGLWEEATTFATILPTAWAQHCTTGN